MLVPIFTALLFSTCCCRNCHRLIVAYKLCRLAAVGAVTVALLRCCQFQGISSSSLSWLIVQIYNFFTFSCCHCLLAQATAAPPRQESAAIWLALALMAPSHLLLVDCCCHTIDFAVGSHCSCLTTKHISPVLGPFPSLLTVWQQLLSMPLPWQLIAVHPEL